MSLIVEFLGNMTKCLNSKKMLRSNCMSSNSDDITTNTSNKIAIRNRIKMEKKLERLSNLTKKLLDDLEEQEDINNNNSVGECGELYIFTTNHHQDTDNDENETRGIHNNLKLATTKDFSFANSDGICLKECVVCLASPARIETMPCRHTVLCKRCFLRTIQTIIAQGTANLKCVLCRTKIVAINELEPIARRSGGYNVTRREIKEEWKSGRKEEWKSSFDWQEKNNSRLARRIRLSLNLRNSRINQCRANQQFPCSGGMVGFRIPTVPPFQLIPTTPTATVPNKIVPTIFYLPITSAQSMIELDYSSFIITIIIITISTIIIITIATIIITVVVVTIINIFIYFNSVLMIIVIIFHFNIFRSIILADGFIH